MADYSIFIADNAEEVCRGLEEKLNGSCRVSCFSSGEALLETIGRECPDLLVTELLLPGMDGLSLLEILQESERRIPSVVLTSYVSPYILERLSRLGTVAVLEKPCNLDAAADRILRVIKQDGIREAESLRCRISGLLLNLGISPKLRGYAYLREAICQMAADSDRSMVKELYASVGLPYGITAKHVEHSIRGAIREAWDHRNAALWTLYFGEARPTGAAFIQTLAASLEEETLPEQKLAAGGNG